MDSSLYVERARADYHEYLGVEVVRARHMHLGRQNTVIYIEDVNGRRSCVRYRTAVDFWYEPCIKEPFIESLHAVDIPRVYFASDVVRPQILISEYVPGTSLHDMVVGPEHAAQIGRILSRLHAPSAGSSTYNDFVANVRSEQTWAEGFVSSLHEAAHRCGYHTDDVLRLLGRLADAIAEGNANALVLIHNDLHYRNMILRPTGSVCLLDWDSASIAPFEKDFAKLLDWSHHNKRAFDGVRAAYEAQSGRTLNGSRLQLFRLFTCLRQIDFQTRSRDHGIDQRVLAQGGFMMTTDAQRLRLTALLATLGQDPWRLR